MPGSQYLLFSTLTAAGRRSLHRHPERLEQVNREIEQLGCRVVAQYALLAEDQIGRPAAGSIVSFRPIDGGPAPGGREIA